MENQDQSADANKSKADEAVSNPAGNIQVSTSMDSDDEFGVLADESEDDRMIPSPTDCIQIGTSQDRTSNQFSFGTSLDVCQSRVPTEVDPDHKKSYRRRTYSSSQWEKMERIGGDGFGIVRLAINRKTGELCAVKEFFDTEYHEITKSLHQEMQILTQLRHLNIVKYYGTEIVGNQISLYMEYVQPGSLGKYINTHGALEESLVREFTAQILSGLVYLHGKRVVHRDIKADNLLFDSYNVIKLADFGLAQHLNHFERGIYWTAPEIFEHKEYNSSSHAFAADIWSLGCAIIEMLTGKHPWLGFEPLQVMFRVCHHKQNPPIPETLSPEGKDFLERCFTRNPTKRPSAKALLKHSFVKEKRMLTCESSTWPYEIIGSCALLYFYFPFCLLLSGLLGILWVVL